MVSIIYSHRIICDCSFIKWLLSQEDKHQLFTRLMHIKGSSEQWRKHHNLILNSEIKKNKSICKIDEETIGAIFKKTEDPEFINQYKDQETKNLLFTIDLTDEKPFKCYFLTSPENELSYKQNKHYNGITAVQIMSDNRAREIIDDFFLAFCIERDNAR